MNKESKVYKIKSECDEFYTKQKSILFPLYLAAIENITPDETQDEFFNKDNIEQFVIKHPFVFFYKYLKTLTGFISCLKKMLYPFLMLSAILIIVSLQNATVLYVQLIISFLYVYFYLVTKHEINRISKNCDKYIVAINKDTSVSIFVLNKNLEMYRVFSISDFETNIKYIKINAYKGVTNTNNKEIVLPNIYPESFVDHIKQLCDKK